MNKKEVARIIKMLRAKATNLRLYNPEHHAMDSQTLSLEDAQTIVRKVYEENKRWMKMGIMDKIRSKKPENSHEVLRPSLLNSLTIKELSQIHIAKLEKAIKLRKQTLKKLEAEKREKERTLRPYIEERKKLEKGIDEVIKQIRALTPEAISTEGIALAKILYEHLSAMERNDKDHRKLGMPAIYSYSTKDLSLQDHSAVLHFLDRVRAKKIFRPAKSERK